jgi:hypothetical protein
MWLASLPHCQIAIGVTMKKPKDVTELASRLMSAATTPLVAPQAVAAAPTPKPVAEEQAAVVPAKKTMPQARKAPKTSNRSTVSVFLRMNGPLFEEYDQEAVRRTKATGRGVTVQQVILEKLEKTRPTA